MVSEVGGACVTNRDGGIAAERLIAEQDGERTAYERGPPDDHDVLACGVIASAEEQLLNTVRRTGNGTIEVAAKELPKVERVKAIGILFGANTVEDGTFVDVRGEGKLREDRVDLGVGVELVDEF